MAADTRPRCGAKTRNGTPCQQPGVGVGGRCRFHGGKSHPAGPAHPSWKHGGYSSILGRRKGALAELYADAYADADLVSNRRQLALLDVLLHEAVESYADGTAVSAPELRDAKLRLVEARDAGNRALLASRLEVLLGLVDRVADAAGALDRINELVEQRRRVAESEQKRESLSRNSVTAAQAMALLMRLGESVRTHVSDPEARRRIQLDIAGLLGRPGDVTVTEGETEGDAAG